MTDTILIGGYGFLTLALMFGGRRRRSFIEASHTAAALVVGTLCLVALLLFVAGSVRHLVGAQNNALAATHPALLEDR
jgi:hypothetical protein